MKTKNNVLIVSGQHGESKNYSFRGYHLFFVGLVFFAFASFIGLTLAKYVYLYGQYREGKKSLLYHQEQYSEYAETISKISANEKESYLKLNQFLKANGRKSQNPKKSIFGIGGDETSEPPLSMLKEESNEERFYRILEDAQKSRYDYSAFESPLSAKLKGMHRTLVSLPVSLPVENFANVEMRKSGMKIVFQLKEGVLFESILANARGVVKNVSVDKEGAYAVEFEYAYHITAVYSGLNKILVHKGDQLERFDKIGYIDKELSYQLKEFGDEMNTGKLLYELYEESFNR